MIPVIREDQDLGGPPYETCCICGKETPFWTDLEDRDPGEQVACCTTCAKGHTPAEVPTKAAWCEEVAARLGPVSRA